MHSISHTISALGEEYAGTEQEEQTVHRAQMLTGKKLSIIRLLIWLSIFAVACRQFKNPLTAFKKLLQLRKLRNKYRSDRVLQKYAQHGKRYFINYNTPGWPSAAFNRYIRHQLSRIDGKSTSIHTLVFAITKKCGFQCEHCCEWLNLNKPETLSREDLLLIIHRFHRLGISQVQLSGGEPLNRIDDIYFLLENAPKGIDFWLYTTGYSLSPAKAGLLKKRGLTGITISLDDHVEERHNAFRGVKDAYERALRAVRIAKEEGLLVCFSICATRSFISLSNLFEYGALAKDYGVSFIQVLEPKAVGHYAGKDVLLGREQQEMLERFYETLNYDPDYAHWPGVVYHGYNNRHFGCSGSGNDYVYADTDGDIHNCPFCYRKHFSAFDDDLPELLLSMKNRGCNALDSCTIK
jgi:MoaA/NifB/PqqE/SkfB family radical SAM enzyme